MFRIFYLFIGLACAIEVLAEDRYILFGGGPLPEESQISIEKNTFWILTFLQETKNINNTSFYYTDGEGNKPDIRVSRDEPITAGFEILTRTFRKESELGIHYRQNIFTTRHSSAAAYDLEPELKKHFLNATKQDSVTLIYQGHGGYQPADTRNNFFRLWDNTKINVIKLASLMSLANDDATIRFVFPQCFSGAFSKVIYHNANPEAGLAINTRCGFLAQPDHLESEGCTDSVYTGDYRDYSSYFFSALSGKTINGKHINGQPDWDGDGIVTLRESHFYTLEHARSIDFSRATSEDYLENWQPWYLKWAPTTPQLNNEYAQLAERLAVSLGYNGVWSKAASQLWHDIQESETQVSSAKQLLKKLQLKIKKVQKHLQFKLLLEWPYLKNPYGQEYQEKILTDLPSIITLYEQHPDYLKLQELQNEYEDTEVKELDLRRQQVQLRKVIRFRKLATLLDQFQYYANETLKQEYQRLLSCEDSAL